eukprot:m.252342 g.252342  ORF g.252342 m.252342 type:complete len:73 (+) comp40351_c0_seq25:926-1144(+)
MSGFILLASLTLNHEHIRRKVLGISGLAECLSSALSEPSREASVAALKYDCEILLSIVDNDPLVTWLHKTEL